MPPATLCCTPERRGVARARGSRTRGGLAAAGQRRQGGARALRDGVAQGGQAAVGRAGAAAEPARWRLEMWRGSLLGDNTLAKHGAEAAAEWPQLVAAAALRHRCGAAAQARHVRVEQLGGVDGSRVMRACCCGDVT